MDDARDARPPRPDRGGCARIAGIHLLLGASILGAMSLGLLPVTLAAGAPRFVVGCVALLVGSTATGLLALTARARLRRAAWIALAVAGATTLALVAPWPRSPRPAHARSMTLEGADAPAPWFGGIPEREVVRLGAFVGVMPPERRWLEERLFERAYDEIARGDAVDPDVSFTFDAWLFDRRHLWLATPPGDAPAPLLVFLHGNGGPFHFYPHALARAATSRGLALALPTWGFGDWSGPAARARIAETVEAVARVRAIDRRRVFLGGLSAGSLGAIDAFARDDARAFAACVGISGVRELPPLGDPAFGGRPLLLIHGARDARLPLARARALEAEARRLGGDVTLDVVEDGDHFLLLTHPQLVARALDWLAAQRR